MEESFEGVKDRPAPFRKSGRYISHVDVQFSQYHRQFRRSRQAHNADSCPNVNTFPMELFLYRAPRGYAERFQWLDKSRATDVSAILVLSTCSVDQAFLHPQRLLAESHH